MLCHRVLCGRLAVRGAVLLSLMLACRAAVAAPADRQLASFASNGGNVAYLAAGVALPLFEDGRRGRTETLRALDSLGTALLLTEGLKSLVHERRPNGKGSDSFPSGHATAAFAIATAESSFHPDQAPLWYGGAALIGWSRVRLRWHHTRDVLAGAAIGWAATRWELSSRRGLLLTPWISPSRGSAGVQAFARF